MMTELVLVEGVSDVQLISYYLQNVEQHRVNHMIVEKDISSLMVVTDRDEASDARIRSQINDALKAGLVPDLNQINNANKATVGTFFSVRYPKKAMRSFGVFISTIDWSKSASLNQLFLPFQCLGENKPLEN